MRWLAVLVLLSSCRRESPPAYAAPGVTRAPYPAPYASAAYPAVPQPTLSPSYLPSPPPSTPPTAVGKASYYADSLAGNRTANGEVYDPKMLTAAHRKLPFGTVVDVTRSDTRATVRVRINDRGPFARGRVIDLSRRAAETIGMIRAGVVNVELRIVARP